MRIRLSCFQVAVYLRDESGREFPGIIFASTVPHYHCDVVRSHFRMTSSTFEMLSHLLSASDHIPKANRCGKPCIHPRKQIAVAVWALVNQESCRQISDRFDFTMSSVTRSLLWRLHPVAER